VTGRTFETLDRLEVPDLRRDIERRRMVPDELRPIPKPPAGGRRITAALLALALFAAAAAFGLRVWTRDQQPRPVADPWSWAGEGWTALPAPPEWRDGASIVWTGSELLYWGGTPREEGGPPRADGFIFDPTARDWQPMPAADLPGSDAKAVWTGSLALFWDSLDEPMEHAVQGYDPATGSWYRFPSPPHDPTSGGTYLWTGSELIVFGGGPQGAPLNTQGAAFDPTSGTWRPIANAPVGLNLVNSAWTGDSMVVVGSDIDNGNHASTATSVAMAYDPIADSWTRLPDPPVSAQTAAPAFVGGRLIAWEPYTPASAEYLPSQDRWRSLDEANRPGSECYADGLTIPDVLFAWACGSPVAWFAATSGWVGLRPPIDSMPGLGYGFGRAFGAGTAAVVEQVETIEKDGSPYVGSPDAPMHLWLWRPPAQPPSAVVSYSTEDAGNVVGSFIGDWGYAQAFLPTMATSDAIERCETGFDGIAPFGKRPDFRMDFKEIQEVSPGVFRVPLDLVIDGVDEGSVVFTVGPGTTADGRAGAFVIRDVQGR
jgi:hypothetical protein